MFRLFGKRRAALVLALVAATSFLLIPNTSDVVRALAPAYEAAVEGLTDLKGVAGGLPFNLLAALMGLHILLKSAREVARIVRQAIAEARRCPTFRARLKVGLVKAAAVALALTPVAYHGHKAMLA